MTAYLILNFDKVFSIRIPPIFLPSDNMSLGHLTVTLGTSKAESASHIAIDTTIEMRNCRSAGRVENRFNILKVRLSPGFECQELALWPRPLVWFSATTTVLSTRKDSLANVLRYVLVDSVALSLIIFTKMNCFVIPYFRRSKKQKSNNFAKLEKKKI